MSIAAVYLDHHWVIDVLAGWATAVIAVFLARRWVAMASPARHDAVQAALAEPERKEAALG